MRLREKEVVPSRLSPILILATPRKNIRFSANTVLYSGHVALKHLLQAVTISGSVQPVE